MSHKNNRFGSRNFHPTDESRFERSRDTRKEMKMSEDLPKVVFSFKDLDVQQIPPGQS